MHRVIFFSYYIETLYQWKFLLCKNGIMSSLICTHSVETLQTKAFPVTLTFHEQNMVCNAQHKKPVTTMLTYPWKCTVLHCNHLGNTWKPLVLMTRHFNYYLSANEGDNQSVRSSAPVVSRCFPGGYNVKLYISRGRLAWWLLAFLHSDACLLVSVSEIYVMTINNAKSEAS